MLVFWLVENFERISSRILVPGILSTIVLNWRYFLEIKDLVNLYLGHAQWTIATILTLKIRLRKVRSCHQPKLLDFTEDWILTTLSVYQSIVILEASDKFFIIE